jgi:cytoskeletal protein CcmA (bactofilin family)
VSLFGKSPKDAPPEPRPEAGLGVRPPSAPRGSEDVQERPWRPERPQGTKQGGGSMANIGKSITIKGDLSGNEDLQIDGTVEGRIDLPNNELTVGPEGKVKAEVHAKTVIVVGHVTGNVTAVERAEVQASGVVDGDVRAPRLIVAEGAVLNGAVEMGETRKSAASAPAPKAAIGGGSGPL